MNTKQLLRRMFFIVALAIPGNFYAMGADGRPQRDGGNENPGWSKRIFQALDTYSAVINTPLDAALNQVMQCSPKVRFFANIFFLYGSYCSKDKLAEHGQQVVQQVQNAPHMVSRFMGIGRKKQNKQDVQTNVVLNNEQELSGAKERGEIQIASNESDDGCVLDTSAADSGSTQA